MKFSGLFKKKELVSLEPKINASFISLLKDLHQRGLYSVVVRGCNEALIIDPANSELYLIRGLARYRLSDIPGANQDLSKAVSIINSK